MGDFKEKIKNYLDERKEEFINISHEIHSKPEIGNQEFFASDLLARTLEKEGFEITKNIAGYETGFIAKKTLGEGGPNIAFLGEYDALEGLGHACGHNMIGTISAAAAIATANCLKGRPGSLYFFGCPAEEGGVDNASSKSAYVKEGYFKDIDAAMQLHASGRNSITTPHLAVDSWRVEFFGKPAHAAADPEKGINALDAMILFFSAIGLLRQQLKDEARLHGVILKGGDAPNIIPEYTMAKLYVRAETKEYCSEISQRVLDICKGAALSTGCEYKMERYKNAVDNFLLCPGFDGLYKGIGEELGMIFEEDLEGKGSSDVGNVTQLIPTIQPYIKIGEDSICAHTAAFREAAVSMEADNAVILGAKALAICACELITNKSTLEAIKSEYKEILSKK